MFYHLAEPWGNICKYAFKLLLQFKWQCKGYSCMLISKVNFHSTYMKVRTKKIKLELCRTNWYLMPEWHKPMQWSYCIFNFSTLHSIGTSEAVILMETRGVSPKPEINSIWRQCANVHSDLGILPKPWVTFNLKTKDQSKSVKAPRATTIDLKQMIKLINLT